MDEDGVNVEDKRNDIKLCGDEQQNTELNDKVDN